MGIAIDNVKFQGSVVVADQTNDAIRRITHSGANTTVESISRVPQRGIIDGPLDVAVFSRPRSVAVDSRGDIIVAEQSNCIRKIDLTAGRVLTIAGKPQLSGKLDGVGENALFHGPSSVCVGPDDSIFVVDSGNKSIRKIAPNGAVSTIIGDVPFGDRSGPISAVNLDSPQAIHVSGDDLLISQAHTISLVHNGNVKLLVDSDTGRDAPGPSGTTKVVGSFGAPVFDATGQFVIFPDLFTHQICYVSVDIDYPPNCHVKLLAGKLNKYGRVDGPPSESRFSKPFALARSANTLYISDNYNHCIRAINDINHLLRL
ncbi:copper amine oxidase domain protein [Pelomyxa schiedti]|nr:copper amine oxidase domain protein [Pelomyxa schiedti]